MINNALEQKNMALEAEMASTRKILAALLEREAQERTDLKQAMQDIVTLKRMVMEQTQKTLTAEKTLAKAIRENGTLQAKITSIYHSASWRITGPLRYLKYLLKLNMR